MAELGLEPVECASRAFALDCYTVLPLNEVLSIMSDTQWLAVAIVVIPFPLLVIQEKNDTSAKLHLV